MSRSLVAPRRPMVAFRVLGRALLALVVAAASPRPALAEGQPLEPAGATGESPLSRPLSDEDLPWRVGVSSEQQAEALRLFEEGNASFVRSEYAVALAAYESAIAHWDHPAILFNMTVCLVHLDEPVAALEALQRALRYGQGPLDDGLYAEARTYEKLLLGRLALLRIACAEKDADVRLDGRPLFVGPGEDEVWLLPGAHQAVVRKDGFLTASRELDLRASERTELEVELIPLDAVVRQERRWHPAIEWSVLGGGVAALGVGVALFFDARAKFDDFDAAVADRCPAGCAPGELPGNVTDLRGRARAEHYASLVLFGVGGAAVVTGVVLALLNQPRAVPHGTVAAPTSASLDFAPVGPTGARISLTVGF